MPTLIVASLDDFIEEIEDNTAMLWGEDQLLEDQKGKRMTGFLLVLSCNRNNSIIRYVENIGIAEIGNEKAREEAIEKRAERVKEIQKKLAEKGKAYATGLWSNE